jgi:hypothetical protein
MPARRAGSLSTTYRLLGIRMPSIKGISHGVNNEGSMVGVLDKRYKLLLLVKIAGGFCDQKDGKVWIFQ